MSLPREKGKTMGTLFLSYLSHIIPLSMYLLSFYRLFSDTLIHVHHLSSVCFFSSMILRYLGVGFKCSELDESQCCNTGCQWNPAEVVLHLHPVLIQIRASETHSLSLTHSSDAIRLTSLWKIFHFTYNTQTHMNLRFRYI